MISDTVLFYSLKSYNCTVGYLWAYLEITEQGCVHVAVKGNIVQDWCQRNK